MKILTLLTIYFACLSTGVFAQGNNDRPAQALEVKAAIEKATANGKVRARGVRYDLRLFDGEIAFSDERSFTITPRKKKGSQGPMTIPYNDVIELETEATFLSFFPNPDQKPFAEWSGVEKLLHGESVDIDLIDKEQLFGVVLKTSDSELTIMQGNKTLSLKRESVARVLLARRDTPEAKKILRGAGKGAGSVPTHRAAGPVEAIVQTAILAGGAIAGGVAAAAKRYPNDRLLIYAK